MRQIKLNLVLGLIGTIQGFGTILFLTQGGPAYGTTVPGYQMYDEAFKLDRLGYASAIGLVMFIVGIAISVFLLIRAIYFGPSQSPPLLQNALASFVIPLIGRIAMGICRSLGKQEN